MGIADKAKGPRFKIELEFRNGDFCEQQTQLTYDTKSRNRTRVTLMRGKRSNRYATHASLSCFHYRGL
jgi:hypothetical protein